jgi:SAM-dependent methyltransferase
LTIAPYDLVADEYYDASHKTSRNFDVTTRAAVASVRSRIPEHGLVLEVGAGRGRCQEFLGIDAGARVVQLDNSRAMLGIPTREPSLLQVLHRAEELPFIDEQFSCVAAFLCDPFLGLNFLAESYRVIKPGGLFIGTTPAYEWGATLRKELSLDPNETRFIARDESKIVVPSVLVSRQQLSEMLAAAGFEPAHLVIESHRLPLGTKPVSPDIERPAKSLGMSPFELEILYTIVGKK